jgi:hypothetical protein
MQPRESGRYDLVENGVVFTDRKSQLERQVRMAHPYLLYRGRQVLAHVTALPQEHRDDAQRPATRRDQSVRGLRKVGLHELEKGELHRKLGSSRANFAEKPFEGLPPARVAGAVREKDEAGLCHAVNLYQGSICD